jgi:hypothetical protein
VNLLLPAIVDIFKADSRLNISGKPKIYIDYRDTTRFVLGAGVNYIQNLKQIPCIIFDSLGKRIEKTSIAGMPSITGKNTYTDGNDIEEVLRLQCIVITSFVGIEGDKLTLIGNSSHHGIYDLEDIIQQIFWDNKVIKDINNNIITSGQKVFYSSTRRTYTNSDYSVFMAGLEINIEYFRIIPYNPLH